MSTQTLNRYGQRPYPFAERCAKPRLECSKHAALTCPLCEGRFCRDHYGDHDCPGEEKK